MAICESWRRVMGLEAYNVIVHKHLQTSKKDSESRQTAGTRCQDVAGIDRLVDLGRVDRPLLRQLSVFQPSAEGAATQPQQFRGLGHIALRASHGPFNHQFLHAGQRAVRVADG